MKACDGSIFDSKTETLPVVVFLALGYWALAVLADQLSLPGQVTAIWPASGLAAAAVIVFGFRVWPGIVIGVYLNQMTWFYRGREAIAENGFVSEFLHHSLVGLSFSVGNTLEALFIVWLVKRFIGTENPLAKLPHILRLIILVPFVGPVVGALLGTLVTCGLWQWVPWSGFFSTAWTWWLSAVAGVLVVMPPLLCLNSGKPVEIGQTLARRAEFGLLTGCFLTLLVTAFWLSLPIEYLLILVLLWSAIRFGQVTTVWLGTILACFAIFATVNGKGPFVSTSVRELTVNQTLVLLQCFTSTLIITAGLVAAVVSEWRKNQRDLVVVNATLEQRVQDRTAELNVAKDLAEKANAAKSRFFAAASHDLRQPLHAMSFFVDSLLMDSRSHPPTPGSDSLVHDPTTNAAIVRTDDQLAIVQKLRRTVDNMRDLFNGILDISRIDANVVSPASESFPLSSVLNQLNREYGAVAREHGLKWHCDLDDTVVQSDPILLERILRNLLDNAIKFTTDGEVSIRVARQSDSVIVSIRDSGVGISPAQQSVIFEEFYQIDDSQRRGEKGLGLGLSIVRKLSALLELDLKLESSVNGGTTVRLELPSGDASADHTIPAGHEVDQTVAQTPPDQKAAKILIIDDDANVIDATQSLLSRWGYDVRVASTEVEMIDRLADKWRPEIAVADYKLSNSDGQDNGKTGLDLLDSLRELTGTPTHGLILSADTQPAFLKEMQDRDIQLLTKPLKPAQLRSVIRAALRADKEPVLT